MDTKYFGWGPPSTTSDKTKYLARSVSDMVCERESRIIQPVLTGPKYETKKFFAWWASRKLFGKDILHTHQFSGSCVGASAGNLLNYTQCIEIATKNEPEEFKYIFYPYHYGAGRKRAGYTRKGDGSYGAAQAEAILQDGCIPDDLTGLPRTVKTSIDWEAGYDTEMDWSGRDRDGSWDFGNYVSTGIEHRIQNASKVTSAEKAAEFVLNGYLLQVCSDVGYGRLDSAGFNVNDRNWNHAMLIAGVDIGYKIPYFIIINSWSDVHPRLKDFETGEEYPIGCLRVRFDHADRMFRQQDTFVYSALNGFPRRQLDISLFAQA